MKEERKEENTRDGHSSRNEKQATVIDCPAGECVVRCEPRKQLAGKRHAGAEDQEIGCPLRACPDVRREDRVDIDVYGGEEKRVADSVENLDRDDERLV